VRVLASFEPVVIIVPTRRSRRRAAAILKSAGIDRAAGRVRFVTARTDRSWLRDTMPSLVVRELNGLPLADPKPVAAVAWRFNGWAKYANHRRDARLARKVCKVIGLRRFKPRVEIGGAMRRAVLEGGAIDLNGRGSVLATEECLLTSEGQVRNLGLDRAGYESLFSDYLGAGHTIWLGRGIAGDDTHGHVDDVARFVAADTVVAAVEHDRPDANHEPLTENLRRLRAARDQDGRPLRIVELPMPRPLYFDGERLPASYLNFYVANGVVLVPTFNDPRDREALDVLASVFADRQVVGVHSTDLVLGLGTLHCLAHEQPASPAPVEPQSAALETRRSEA
jgi:agmatine deiminase